MYISKDLVLFVWDKGRSIPGQDPVLVRMDRFGSMIKLNEYGNTNSVYGREIDHIIPVDRGGTNHLINLEPLQWQNNRKKSNNLI